MRNMLAAKHSKVTAEVICKAYSQRLRISSGEEVSMNFLNMALALHRTVFQNSRLKDRLAGIAINSLSTESVHGRTW